jgi:hypothetical protein
MICADNLTFLTESKKEDSFIFCRFFLACLAPAIQVVKEDRKTISSGSHETKPDEMTQFTR